MSQQQNPGAPSSHPTSAIFEAGFLVGNGRFTLIRPLGRGGMGVVWLAHDESLHEEVALKFLPPEIRFDAVALDDLRRETARARKLTHPNIIRIHDLYKDAREAFISMEFVDGWNLSDRRLQQPDRVFTWKFLEPIVKQLCEALDYAHGEKVIHRDLKPGNLMLDSRDRLKLADFGIAAQVSDSVSRVSMRHAQSGTVTYMSPQQMDGKLPQVSDDIYALGATLYELLTSKPPFFTGDIPHQVRNLLPQPIDERLAELGIENDVPRPVAAMVMACLGKSPEQRPASARAVAEWIGFQPATQPSASLTDQSATELHERTPEAVRTPEAEPVAVSAEDSNAWEETEPDHGGTIARQKWRWVVAAVLISGLGAGVWAWRNRDRSEGTDSKPTVANGSRSEASFPPLQPIPEPTDRGEFVTLFNGRDLTGWSGDTNIWSVQDGVIHAKSGRRAPRTAWCLFWQGEVGDFELRLQFRRWSGNSGVFYRAKSLPEGAGGYQFDIASGITGNLLDSGGDRSRRELFRVKSGIGGASSSGSGWHELVITAVGSRLVHQLDGVTLCDIQDTYSEAPRTGLIGLEASSDTIVEFKDIRLKRMSGTSSMTVVSAGGNWITLFDGNSLAAWQGWNGAGVIGAWQLANDELRTVRGAKAALATRDQFGDFELELEWKVEPGANSGIFYRAVTSPDPIPQTSPEYQVVDDSTADGRRPITAAGSIYGVLAPSNKRLKTVGEFNVTRIVMRGKRVEHWLNGAKILEADLSSPEVKRIAFKKYKNGWGQAARGHIVLQNLGYEVSYRNIRVRKLDGN